MDPTACNLSLTDVFVHLALDLQVANQHDPFCTECVDVEVPVSIPSRNCGMCISFSQELKDRICSMFQLGTPAAPNHDEVQALEGFLGTELRLRALEGDPATVFWYPLAQLGEVSQ